MSENKRRAPSTLAGASREFWDIDRELFESPLSRLITGIVTHFDPPELPDTTSNHNTQSPTSIELIGYSKYPPYNIFKEDDRVVVEIAVAGFKRSELAVTLTTNPDGREEVLVVGKKEACDKPLSRVYQHQGLAAREFKQRFSLGTYEVVDGVTHEDGILRIVTKQKRVEEPAVKVLTIK